MPLKINVNDIGYEVVNINSDNKRVIIGKLGILQKICENGYVEVDFGYGENICLKYGKDVVFTRQRNETINLDEEDLQELHSRISNEGFAYCFLYYSKFEHIADKQFHRLRKEFIACYEALEKYLKYGEFGD